MFFFIFGLMIFIYIKFFVFFYFDDFFSMGMSLIYCFNGNIVIVSIRLFGLEFCLLLKVFCYFLVCFLCGRYDMLIFLYLMICVMLGCLCIMLLF